MSREAQGQLARANAMTWACWPHNCPRVVLSSSGIVSLAAEWLAFVAALPQVGDSC